jgi:3-phenylpropionate/trans-cinnamate dioxygenase alpha subunit
MLSDGPFVDVERRTVSPRVFYEPEVYERERALIFARSWLYLGHESEIEEKNSYVSADMGGDPVILWRGPDGKARAFLNTCTHRGVKICRVDRGKSKVLTCPYHGWSFNSAGELAGVPARERYGPTFNPQEWGLLEVPRVEAYAGLVFGNMNPEAESLVDFLGDIRWYLDTQFKRTAKGRVVFPGVQKITLDVNWKLASEQFGGDSLHVSTAHRSCKPLGMLGDPNKFHKGAPLQYDFNVSTDQGHGWASLSPDVAPGTPVEQFDAYEAEVYRNAPDCLTPRQKELTLTGAVGFVFPNFAFISFLGGFGLRLFVPKGPQKTEVWFWSAADAEAPDWRKELSRQLNIRSFTAGGVVDADDNEMWLQAQKGLTGYFRRNKPFNYQLGLGIEGVYEDERPGRLDNIPIESGVIGFHRRWHQLMEGGGDRPYLAEAAE